jgi:D-glycero-D-manno-heptose 1,7-bisphosphate phosphatase
MGIHPVSESTKKKAIFLDRDGVINNAVIRDGKPYPPSGLDEISINEGVKPSLRILHDMGFLLIVITNQPDVSRNRITKESVESINAFLKKNLPLDEIKVCYHDNSDQCECRKPKPGQLIEASKQYNIDLAKSFMVGDRWSDIEAGKRAGCKTIFIDNGYLEKKPEKPDFTIKKFNEIINIIKNDA